MRWAGDGLSVLQIRKLETQKSHVTSDHIDSKKQNQDLNLDLWTLYPESWLTRLMSHRVSLIGVELGFGY